MIDQVLRYGPWVVMGSGLLFIAHKVATKGFKGAMFGGKIRRTFGEIPLGPVNGPSGVVRVHEIVGKNESYIGIEIVQKTKLSYDMTPITISRPDTAALIEMLEQAIESLNNGMNADTAQHR